MASATSRQANAADEQIVMQALDIVKMACDGDVSFTVLAWERQALHLALRRSYNRSDIRNQGTRANGDILYAVRSDSRPGTFYHVTVHPIARPECNCLAGQRQQPCKHAGVCLGDWAERADTARRAAEASEQDEYAHLSRDDRREYGELMAAHYDAMEAAGR